MAQGFAGLAQLTQALQGIAEQRWQERQAELQRQAERERQQAWIEANAKAESQRHKWELADIERRRLEDMAKLETGNVAFERLYGAPTSETPATYGERDIDVLDVGDFGTFTATGGGKPQAIPSDYPQYVPAAAGTSGGALYGELPPDIQELMQAYGTETDPQTRAAMRELLGPEITAGRQQMQAEQQEAELFDEIGPLLNPAITGQVRTLNGLSMLHSLGVPVIDPGQFESVNDALARQVSRDQNLFQYIGFRGYVLGATPTDTVQCLASMGITGIDEDYVNKTVAMYQQMNTPRSAGGGGAGVGGGASEADFDTWYDMYIGEIQFPPHLTGASERERYARGLFYQMLLGSGEEGGEPGADFPAAETIRANMEADFAANSGEAAATWGAYLAALAPREMLPQEIIDALVARYQELVAKAAG